MQKTNPTAPKRRRLNWRLVAGIGLVAAMIGIALVVVALANPSRPTSKTGSSATVTRGSITGSVLGTGTIYAEQNVNLVFQTNGLIKEILVKEGDTVKEGQVLARIDDQALRSDVSNAQASLASAKAKLQQTQHGNATQAQTDSAQASVASAQAAYDAAVKTAETETTTLISLKATLQNAQVDLQKAQSAYDKVAWRSDIGMMSEARDLQKATNDYNKAKADYDVEAKTGAPNNQAKVQSALATLQSAKADLAKLTGAGSETDIAIQQAAVQQAEETLTQAQISLEKATLKAPFTGIITAINVTVGSSSITNNETVAMKLLNRNPLHIDFKLSENDVVKVQQDQNVELTIDSLPDWKQAGTVKYISPSSETTNGVVTYAVRVNLDDKDQRVKVGMTANVKIITAQKENVLLVPTSALLPKGSGHVVEVIGSDGKTKQVDVVTGISDGSQTEIVSGLTEGQQINALPGSSSPQSGGPFGG
jgi:HlyD family secretion protein